MKQFAFGLKLAAAVFGIRSAVISHTLTGEQVAATLKSVVDAWDAAFPNEKVPQDLLDNALVIVSEAFQK